MAQPAEVAPYRLVEIEDRGRGLVAAKDLEVGDLVFEEKAFQALFLAVLSRSPCPGCEMDFRAKRCLVTTTVTKNVVRAEDHFKCPIPSYISRHYRLALVPLCYI